MSPSLKEMHFLHTTSQTNVYGTAEVCLPNCNKILIATSQGIHALDFQRIDDSLKPVSKKVQFTYIPADAEIVSIDAFNRWQYGEGLVIGICFIKDAESSKPSQFLNIYTATEPGGEFNLDSIANGCRDHALPFFPYQLYHADLFVDGIREVAFLLSGSDQSIHLFREDRLMMNLGYSEQPVEIYFPEFSHFKSNVLWMDIRHNKDFSERTSVTGTQNGTVRVSVVETSRQTILRSWDVSHDSPITCVKLFSRNFALSDVCPKTWQPIYEERDVQGFPYRVKSLIEKREDLKPRDENLQLIVTTALDPAIIYSNIKLFGLTKSLELPESTMFDCVLGACASDVDMDGDNEIVLTSYGQAMLIYKLQYSEESLNEDIKEIDQSLPNECETPSFDGSPNGSSQNLQSNSLKCTMIHSTSLLLQMTMPYPLLGVKCMDLTGDGVLEMVLVSVKGLHVLQHDPNQILPLLTEKLRRLKMLTDS